MKRLRGHKPLPEVQSRMASLDDELALSAIFVATMCRRGQTRAALGVLDEQRDRLQEAQRSMLRALGAARRRRMRVAVAGVAAMMALSSGAVAAVRMRAPSEPRRAALLEHAQSKLTEAAGVADEDEFRALVEEAHRSILALSRADLADPELRGDVAEFLDREVDLLQVHPSAEPALLARVARVARTMRIPVNIPDAEEPAEGPSTAPPAAPAP